MQKKKAFEGHAKTAPQQAYFFSLFQGVISAISE